MTKKTITTILIVLIFILLILAIFVKDIVPRELFNEFEIFIYASIGIAIIFIIFIIIFISKYKPGVKDKKSKYKKEVKIESSESDKQIVNKKELEDKRDSIIQELKEAENQFLKNKISKETFNKITKDKNAELIKLEANIDVSKKLSMSIEDAKILEEVSTDKKNVLKGLFLEKQRKVHELQLTEKGYLKRKIDESTYKKISEDVKSEIISIEGKIKALQKSEEIQKLKKQLLIGAKEITKQQKSSKKRIEEQPKTFEDEVFEQIGFR